MHRSDLLQITHILATLLTIGTFCGVSSFVLIQPSSSKQFFIGKTNIWLKPYKSTSTSSSLFYFRKDESSSNDPRESEFSSLEPRQENKTRKSRQEREKLDQVRFATYGNDLWELRSTIDELNQKLADSMSKGFDVEEIKHKLQQAKSRDPYHVYEMELEATEKALEEGRKEDASKHHQEALSARSFLPHFNFEGLWVGKYGDHGFEMINVTYVGDILIGRKVTGDKNVPAGEISFQVDMSPQPSNLSSGSTRKHLSNIVLSEEAAKRWGTRQIGRYLGLGQVAEEGFVNQQWMEGQLIVINEEYFSFSWMALNYQIFFGRPSAELSIKMLRENTSEHPPTIDDDIETMRKHVARSFEVTALELDDELIEGKDDPFSCIYYDEDTCSFE